MLIAAIRVAVNTNPKFWFEINGYIQIRTITYPTSISANLVKNFCPETNILLRLSLSFSASGLYNEDWKTAPTPRSRNAIMDRNCVIELTNPFISEPKCPNINLGRIKPQIIVVICNV